VRGCRPSACPFWTRELFSSTTRALMLYRDAHKAIIRPAGPAPIINRSTEEAMFATAAGVGEEVGGRGAQTLTAGGRWSRSRDGGGCARVYHEAADESIHWVTTENLKVGNKGTG